MEHTELGVVSRTVDKDGDLVVVVCTHNRRALLLDTLRSLDADGSQDACILVVLNNCTDGSLEALRQYATGRPAGAKPLRWIEEGRLGKSNALNAAIQATHQPLLAFVDDDQTVEPGFLSAIVSGAQAFPSDSIFCGRLVPAWDGSEPSWVHSGPPYHIPIRPFPEFDFGDKTFQLPAGFKMPSGGNLVVRRRVFDQIGGFNTNLGPTGHNLVGGEDHEFLQRATAQGCQLRYLPDMRQLHAIDESRLGTAYTLRKSFLRSRSSTEIHGGDLGVRPYMFVKFFAHVGRALFSFDRDRRFYYLVRSAAALGELYAVTARHRSSSS